MKRLVFLAGLLVAYLIVLGPFTEGMQKRTIALRLGYLPDTGLLKLVGADFRPFLAQAAMSKVLFYYGSLVDERFNRNSDRPEYFQMFKMLEKAIQLDPYNQDPYYFAQATFTWELNRAADVNKLLDYGMKFRPGNYWLPFYRGFNTVYFLHEEALGARYFQRAAEISGDSLSAGLAARLYYLSGRNDLAVEFLQVMVKSAASDTIRKVYARRLQGVEAIMAIEKARDRYATEHQGALPTKLKQLVVGGYLSEIPQDPYGGHFYIGADGKVLTTSNMFAPEQRTKSSENRIRH